jgi:hypothetical protein
MLGGFIERLLLAVKGKEEAIHLYIILSKSSFLDFIYISPSTITIRRTAFFWRRYIWNECYNVIYIFLCFVVIKFCPSSIFVYVLLQPLTKRYWTYLDVLATEFTKIFSPHLPAILLDSRSRTVSVAVGELWYYMGFDDADRKGWPTKWGFSSYETTQHNLEKAVAVE